MEQGRSPDPRHLDISNEFVAKTVEQNENKYPCHPENPNRFSRFAVGFSGCLGCGENHHFRECATNQTQHVRINFHFELHCHKPRFWFRRNKNEKLILTTKVNLEVVEGEEENGLQRQLG